MNAQSVSLRKSATLFENVRIFNGTADELSAPSNVLVEGNKISAISSAPITPPSDVDITRIDGRERTLMPGLTDAHTHLYTAGVTVDELFAPNPDLVIRPH